MTLVRIRERHLIGNLSAAQRRRNYDRALGALLEEAVDLQMDAQLRTLRVLKDLQTQSHQIFSDALAQSAGVGTIQTLGRVRTQLDVAAQQFVTSYGGEIKELQALGFDMGVRLARTPFDAAGVVTSVGVGISEELLGVAQGFSADLIADLAQNARSRINGELVAVATGVKTPFQAIGAIGTSLTAPNHFRTLAARARAITVTEVGRIQSVATQLTQEKLAEDVPDMLKAWSNAHLAHPRPNHLAAEARYTERPIAIDKPFTVGGFEAMYPRAATLPASESVHCHCQSVVVVPDETFEEPEAAPAVAEPAEPEEPLLKFLEEPPTPAEALEAENQERLARLGSDMKRPRNWDQMPKTQQLRYIEDQMEADWPKRRRGGKIIKDRFGSVVGSPDDIIDTVFNLKDLDPEIAFSTSNELRRLGFEWPKVAERLDYVGSYRGPKGAPFKRKIGRQRVWSGNDFAFATRDGRQLGLNPKYYGNPTDFGIALRHGVETGFHPLGAELVDSVLQHEWGHQVRNWITQEFSPNAQFLSAVRAQGTGAVSELFDTLVNDRFATGSRGISRYSRKSTHESFAEMFQLWWQQRRFPAPSRARIIPGNVTNPALVRSLQIVETGNNQRAAHDLVEGWNGFVKFIDAVEDGRIELAYNPRGFTSFQTLTSAEERTAWAKAWAAVTDIIGDDRLAATRP